MATKIKQEIRILKQLRHPNVVELKEVLASRQQIFMVMELVPGGELFHKIVAEGPMSVSIQGHSPTYLKTHPGKAVSNADPHLQKCTGAVHRYCSFSLASPLLKLYACRSLMGAVCFNSCWMAWIIAISRVYFTGQMHHLLSTKSTALDIAEYILRQSQQQCPQCLQCHFVRLSRTSKTCQRT